MKEEIRDRILKALRKRPLSEGELRNRVLRHLNGHDLLNILLEMLNDGLIGRQLRSRTYEYFPKLNYELYRKRDERFKNLEKKVGWLEAFCTSLG